LREVSSTCSPFDIEQKIKKAKKNISPSTIQNKNAYTTLLEMARNKLGISVTIIEKIENLTKGIAKYEGKDCVKVEHLAEAIHCYHFYDDHSIIAETGDLKFGPGIKIAQTELSTEDITAAIKHLKSLI
jgi:hypothetical protein